MEQTRIVIAGGGTGGHLMPGLAVADALCRQRAARPVFIGTAHGLESRLVPTAGYELRLIQIGGFKSSGWKRRLHSLAQLGPAIVTCARILRQTRAQAVFGIGGYASGPALAAAALLRIPVVVLEVNARTGLANRLAAPWVRAAAVNFPETAATFRHARQVEVTGVPVRPEFGRSVARDPAGLPLVLVSGGSQGAHALNQVLLQLVNRATPLPFRVRHQTGPADFAAAEAAYAASNGRAVAEPFIANMAAAMAAAAVVVCRAGASTLGELAAMGRASILVPFPGAADQHQLRNAEAFARAGAAVLIEQSQLTPERLEAELRQLLAEPDRIAGMERAARGFAHPNAADAIAALILAHSRPGPRA